MTYKNITRLRHARTRASNAVKRQIEHMLTEPAKWGISGRLIQDCPPYELPSWWPFWSDVLKTTTRVAVQASRALESAQDEMDDED